MSELDGIRARVEAYATRGTPGHRAPQDRAYLLQLIDSLTSDVAVERAAQAIHDMGVDDKRWGDRGEEIQELYREDVRAVIAALKEADA